MYSVEYFDKYVKIIKRDTNEVIASGKVIATKNNKENNGIFCCDRALCVDRYTYRERFFG